MASIRPNDPDDPGPFKITVKHKGERWYFTRDTWRGAQKVAGLAEDDLDNSRDPYARYEIVRIATAGMTVAQWAPVWLSAQDFDERVREKTGELLKRDVIPTFGKLELEVITHIEVKGWYARLRRTPRKATGRPPGPAYVATILSAFRRMMEAAAQEGLIRRSPVAAIRGPRVPVPDSRHVLTPRQVVELADDLARPRPDRHGKLRVTDRPPMWRVKTLVLGWGGSRWEEVGGLRRRPEDIKLMRRPPAIVVTEPIKRSKASGLYHGEPKTDAGRRTIELIQPVADELAVILGRKRVYAFGTRGGTPPSYSDYYAAFKESAERLGHSEWTINDLRHSHATWLKRCNRRAVQERIGHEPQDVTDRYTHVEPDDREEIMDVLQDLWDEARGRPVAARATG